MTAVTATGGNKQSAQTTVSSYRKLFIKFFRGVAWDFVGVRTRGRKVVVPKTAHRREVWGAYATPEIFKFKVSEMPLLAFSAGYFQ